MTRIKKVERDGYLSKPNFPRCPVCAAETDSVITVGGMAVGCFECAEFDDAWETIKNER